MDDDRAEEADSGRGPTGKEPSRRRETLRFGQIFSVEQDIVAPARRTIATAGPQPESDGDKAETGLRVGLALSGGGIRSAAFSLGVLQALDAAGVFRKVDFLSTVSGGGYTGAALIAAMERGDGQFPFDTLPRAGDAMAPADIADSDAVRAIRDRSRYLMPNGKFDLVVSLAIILRGLAVNATMVAATVFLFASITLMLNPTAQSLAHTWAYYFGEAGRALDSHVGPHFLLTKVLGVAFLAWLVLWAIRRSGASASNGSGGAFSDPGSRSARFTAWSMLALLAVFVVELQTPILRRTLWLLDNPAGFRLGWNRLTELATSLAVGTGLFALTWRWLLAQIEEAGKDPYWKAMLRRVSSRIALFVLAMALPALIYLFYLWVTTVGIRVEDGYPAASTLLVRMAALGPYVWLATLSVAALTVWLTIWARSVGPVWQTLPPGRWGDAAHRNSPSRGAIVALILIPATLLVAWLILPRVFSDRLPGTFAMPGVYLLIAISLTLIAGLFTENANSLHRLYRDRLNEAFTLGIDDGAAFPLTRLEAPFPSGRPRRPYLIVNTAINLQGSKAERRGRSADFFIFTPSHVGSDATGYVATGDFEKAEPQVDLATVAAISGASVSSAMGRIGVPILAPTLALLNIRLGYWLRNPGFLASEAQAKAAALKDWKLSYLFYEMMGWLDEKKSKVLLSDGGHIDNLGLYQLLKRRCDIVVVSDAEADPAMNFGSLIDVERFARIDLGVRLNLPWQPIRANALKRKAALSDKGGASSCSPAWSHGAIGEIDYPATVGEPGTPPEPPKKGTILYVKASVSGDERGYILDYERRFPRFPHEPTSDQFFTEEQFEAYRALGFHAMERALNQTGETDRGRELLSKLRGRLGIDAAGKG